MGTKNNPGAYDCFAKAEPDEPMFVLLARDPAAPRAVERWADSRRLLIEEGKKPASDYEMVNEAEACAQAMREWHAKNRPEAPLLLSADEWLALPEYAGLEVEDPDGWDRKNFQASWAEKISKQEFDKRVAISTCSFPPDYFTRKPT